MTKKPKIVIDLNDKIQLDLFGGEDIPVSDEIKEAIDVFKNPPDHSLDNSSVSEKGPPEHFISRSRILKHRAGLRSDLGVALELRVADGEGIIDDGHNPGELDTWVGYLRADYLHFFDLSTAEAFNESNTEILNVQNEISNDGFRGGEPWVNLVFHRDAIEQTSENEYRVSAQISSRYLDRIDQIPKSSHQLYLTDEPSLIDVIIKINPGGKSIKRIWQEWIDENRAESRFEIGSDYRYNNKLSFSEAFHEFRTKNYRIESKKYASIEMYLDQIGMGITGLEYSRPNDIDYIKVGNEMITHIALPIYNKESKFNYKMIPFKLGSKLSKNHLYHLTGSIVNQIKFEQSYWGIDQEYIEMLKEYGDDYYSDYELFEPPTGKDLEALFPVVSEVIEEQVLRFGGKNSRPGYKVDHWMGVPIFSGIKTNKR